MRFVDRTKFSVPKYFGSSQLMQLRREVAKLFEADGARKAQTVVQRDRGMVEEALAPDLRLLFAGKCAYCEQAQGAPYRFRPETEAEPVDDRSTSHLYYCWLATSWDNWLWVCAGCRGDHEASFPVEGRRAKLPFSDMLDKFALPAAQASWLGPADMLPPSWSDLEGEDGRRKERNLLLDPCRDKDIWRHLGIVGDGRLVPLTDRGEATIARFNLQRRELVDGRRMAIEELSSVRPFDPREPCSPNRRPSWARSCCECVIWSGT